MLQRLEELEKSWLKQVEGAADQAALKQIENAALDKKKGELSEILRGIPTLPDAEKRAVGEKANTLKQALLGAIAAREELIRSHELAQHMEEGALDVTLPGRSTPTGRIHPSNQTLREFYDIWA